MHGIAVYCARRAWTRDCCVVENPDELASFQLIEPHPIPHEQQAHAGTYPAGEDQSAGTTRMCSCVLASVRRRIWKFRRGVRREEIGAEREPRSIDHNAWVTAEKWLAG